MKAKRKGEASGDADVATPMSKAAKKALRKQQLLQQQQQQVRMQMQTSVPFPYQMSSAGAGNDPFAFAAGKKGPRAKTDWCNDWNYRECSYGDSCRCEHYCAYCYDLSNGTVKAPHKAKDCALKNGQMRTSNLPIGGVQLSGMPAPNGMPATNGGAPRP